MLLPWGCCAATPVDTPQVKNFIRRVLDVSLEPVGTSCPGMTVLALYLKGTAFLWHQVSNKGVQLGVSGCRFTVDVSKALRVLGSTGLHALHAVQHNAPPGVHPPVLAGSLLRLP